MLRWKWRHPPVSAKPVGARRFPRERPFPRYWPFPSGERHRSVNQKDLELVVGMFGSPIATLRRDENEGALVRHRQAVDCRYGSANSRGVVSASVRCRRDLYFKFPLGTPSETH